MNKKNDLEKIKTKIELIYSLKQKGGFWSYEEKALKNLPENMLIEESLRMGDVPDILLLFRLFSKEKIRQVWKKRTIPDKRIYARNYYLAKIFFNIQNPDNYLKPLQKKFSRYELIKKAST